MQVKIVKPHDDVDGYCNVSLFSNKTSDEKIATYYAEQFGFDVEEFEDKYEIEVETVTNLKK